MKIKRLLLIILSRAIRGAGMGLVVSGILFSVWFFSFHLMKVNIYGVYFQLVIFLLVMLCIGLLTLTYMMNGMIAINANVYNPRAHGEYKNIIDLIVGYSGCCKFIEHFLLGSDFSILQ